MSIDRFDLVKESFEKKPVPAEKPSERPSDYFGELVFDRRKMAKYLDPATFNALLDCMDNGKPFDPLLKADPNIKLAAEERDIGGLGIFMVKKSMDSVEYEYKDNHNILKIKKHI